MHFATTNLRTKWIVETAIALVVLTFLFCTQKLPLVPLIPSGADPGNWLTAAWELGGAHIRLVDWAYPPLFFALLRTVLVIIPPLLAVKSLGIASWLLGAVLFLFAVRIAYPQQNPLVQLAITAFAFFSGYYSEVFAWGGYPQLLAVSFLVVVFPALERWLATSEKKYLLLAALFSALVAYTNHFIFLVVLVYTAALVCIDLLQRHDFKAWVHRWASLFAVLSLLLLPAAVVYWKFMSLAASLPTDPQEYGLADLGRVMMFSFQGQEWLWLTVAGVCVSVALLDWNAPLARTSIVFILTSSLLFLTSREMRFLQVAIVGLGYGLATATAKMETRMKSGWQRLMPIAVMLALLLFTLPAGNGWFVDRTAFYRVLDRETLEGLDWIRANSRPGTVIAASPWKPYTIGWWVEGYANRPCLYALAPGWLTFQGERITAEDAERLFDAHASRTDVTRIVEQYKVGYLIYDRTAAQPSATVISSNFVEVFSNDRLIILKALDSRAGLPVSREASP